MRGESPDIGQSETERKEMIEKKVDVSALYIEFCDVVIPRLKKNEGFKGCEVSKGVRAGQINQARLGVS